MVAIVQIPNLTPAIAVNGTEQLEAVQAGATVRVTSAQIASLAPSIPGPIGPPGPTGPTGPAGPSVLLNAGATGSAAITPPMFVGPVGVVADATVGGCWVVPSNGTGVYTIVQIDVTMASAPGGTGTAVFRLYVNGASTINEVVITAGGTTGTFSTPVVLNPYDFYCIVGDVTGDSTLSAFAFTIMYSFDPG